MRYYNINDIKLEDIYIFITVSEFQNVTKAADYLFLSPPKVSKSIKKLEELWGVLLFTRDNNKMILTPAGQHAYEGLGKIIRQIEKVVDETVQEQRVKPLLRFGCHSMFSSDRFISPLSDAFKEKFPSVTFSVECRDNFGILRKMLLSNEIDVIYAEKSSIRPMEDNLNWQKLHNIPLYIVTNRQNELARREHVTLEDLKSEQIILTSMTTDFHADYAFSLCQKYGFEPSIYRYAPNIYSQITEIYVHSDVTCIIPLKDMNLYINENRIAYWPIEGEMLEMGLAYRKNPNKFIRGFAECAKEIPKYMLDVE